MTILIEAAQAIGTAISWRNIVDFDNVDERISLVNRAIANLIAVNHGYISLCSDNSTPTNDELLAWLWVANPTYQSMVLPYIRDEFLSECIKQYKP